MSRTTARAAAMQMIFEKISGGQGGEETLRMVYDELRQDGLPGVNRIEKHEPDQEDRAYITAALEGVLAHREEIDEKIEKAADFFHAIHQRFRIRLDFLAVGANVTGLRQSRHGKGISGHDLIHGNGTAQNTTAAIGNIHDFEQTLDRPVFTVGPV